MEAFILGTYLSIIWREAWVICAQKTCFLRCFHFICYHFPDPHNCCKLFLKIDLIYHPQHHISFFTTFLSPYLSLVHIWHHGWEAPMEFWFFAQTPPLSISYLWLPLISNFTFLTMSPRPPTLSISYLWLPLISNFTFLTMHRIYILFRPDYLIIWFGFKTNTHFLICKRTNNMALLLNMLKRIEK